MSFKPYTAPHSVDIPPTAGTDLCWRINWQDLSDTVTPAVVGAVTWALIHFPVTPDQKAEIFESLGLEEVVLPTGSRVIRPKD